MLITIKMKEWPFCGRILSMCKLIMEIEPVTQPSHRISLLIVSSLAFSRLFFGVDPDDDNDFLSDEDD